MKNIEKYIKQFGVWLILPALLTGLMFTSCSEEDIVDLEPYNQISDETAFTTPEKIALTVNGMYNAAQIGNYAGGNRGYPFGAAFVQQGDNRGEDVVNWYAFYAITYQATYTPSTMNNEYYWIDTYRLINRCNIVIEGVHGAADEGIISQELANEYAAEAKLLRAASYHELLKMFARPYRHTDDASHYGVPYHKVPFTTADAVDDGFDIGRHSVAECYQWILEDLAYAEQHLPLKSERSGNQRLSKGTREAAAAYKVRVYQHMWDMPNVITHALKFINGPYAGSYELHEEPWEAFQDGAYGSTEHIFGMESSETNYPSVNGALASQYNRRNLVSISPIIWRHEGWLRDDKRRQGSEEMNDPEAMVRFLVGRVLTAKYKRVDAMDDLSPMMRYPEVLLNLAEAYAREGDAANALTYLNKVRDRSLADPATQSYDLQDDFDGDPVNVLEAILLERRIELLMEGSRWPDIHRLQHCEHHPIDGIPAKLDNSVPPASAFDLDAGPYEGPFGVAQIPYDDHRFVWPISQQEINANPTLAAQQNPGY